MMTQRSDYISGCYSSHLHWWQTSDALFLLGVLDRDTLMLILTLGIYLYSTADVPRLAVTCCAMFG